MSSTILYIEDNQDNMQLVQRALKARGYEFVWAASGVSGQVAAEHYHPDLILLDINLPDMDGYAVARWLKSHDRLNAVPVIAVTANALKGDADRALAAGCDGYMSKPINIRELWAQVKAFLPASNGGSGG